MPNLDQFENDLRDRRTLRGWSQEQLARRSGLSRAGIGASRPTGLSPQPQRPWLWPQRLNAGLRTYFGCAVPSPANRRGPGLLVASLAGTGKPRWEGASSSTPQNRPRQGWSLMTVFTAAARSNGKARAAPTIHWSWRPATPQRDCWPPSSRARGRSAHRFTPLQSHGMSLLGRGLVHVAGVHLAAAEQSGGNAAIVLRELGTGYKLLRIARWEEGITFAPGLRLSSVREAVGHNLRWVGREDGSGAHAMPR